MTQPSNKMQVPKSALVAIDHKETADDVTRILHDDYGIETLQVVADGEAAWAALQGGGFECVVFEWKLPKVSGIVLFNRLRQDERHRNIPIMVISSLVQKENFLLLKDYPPTGLTDGAFSHQGFATKFELLIREANWYKDNAFALDAIAANLKEHAPQAEADLSKLVKSSPNPVPILNLAARKFRELKLYEQAEKLLEQSRQLDDSAASVMELAKVYYLTGRGKAALKVMADHKFSVKNLESLLLMGEFNLAEKEPDEARQAFAKALDIDPENQVAKSGVLVADNLKLFASQNGPELMSRSFASVLNLVAVSLVKSSKHEDGVLQYKAALAFIHDPIDKARILYNLGLAYLRAQDKEAARTWFTQSAELGGAEFTRATEQLKALHEPELIPDAKVVEQPAVPIATRRSS